MKKCFTLIVNHLVYLEKLFANGELTNKFLRCLDRAWNPKVKAIVESKDLDTIPLATFFGKRQEHEMKLGRLTLHEEPDKKNKGITITATTSNTKVQEDKSNKEESVLSDFA
ncbi:hypothetical protein Lal_00020977 [Lupinus albus]|nr:hypothetical protein Lal_00020977 [Lupinus albus]